MNKLHLVNPATDGAVQDAADKQALHVASLNVQLSRYELNLDTGVRLDQLNEDLGPDISEQILNMLPDEGVLHDGLPVHLNHFTSWIIDASNAEQSKPWVFSQTHWYHCFDKMSPG